MLKQIGNAVPPLLARALAAAAEAVLEHLDNKEPSSLAFPIFAQPFLELDVVSPANGHKVVHEHSEPASTNSTTICRKKP